MAPAPVTAAGVPAPTSGVANEAGVPTLRAHPSMLNSSPASRALAVTPMKLIAAAATALVLTVVFGTWIFGGGGEGQLGSAGMSRGEASETISDLGQIPEGDRDGAQWLRLGHAYSTIEQTEPALHAFTYASKLGEIDDDAIAFCIAVLSNSLEREVAMQTLLGLSAQSGVDQALAQALSHEKYEVRHAALATMNRRGSKTTKHDVDLAIFDLLGAPDCNKRKRALLRLGEIAGGADRARVIKALQEVEDSSKNQLRSCLVVDLPSVKKKIMGR